LCAAYLRPTARRDDRGDHREYHPHTMESMPIDDVRDVTDGAAENGIFFRA
jgi:hypothetical protein